MTIKDKVEDSFVKIRPYLHIDGGDIEFVKFEETTSTLEIRFKGNCYDCPMAIMTLRAGVERVIKKDIIEVKRIEMVR